MDFGEPHPRVEPLQGSRGGSGEPPGVPRDGPGSAAAGRPPGAAVGRGELGAGSREGGGGAGGLRGAAGKAGAGPPQVCV